MSEEKKSKSINNMVGGFAAKLMAGLGFGSNYNLTTTDNTGTSADNTNKNQETMYKTELNREVKLLYTTKLETRLKACKNIGLIVWDACDCVQKYLVQESHAIDLLLTIFEDQKENDVLRLEVIKTLIVLLKSGRIVFKFMVQIKSIVKTLMHSLNPDEPQIGKWIISGLFYCAVMEIDLALVLVSQSEFEDMLRSMANMDWSTWSGNEAIGLMKMMELSQCEGAHNLIQGLAFGRRASKRDSFQARKESFSRQAKPVYL